MTPRNCKSAAAATLAAAPEHKRITRIYTVVYLALGLAMALASLGGDYLISRTGGLGDLQKRTFISTAQTLIVLVIQAFTPLWTMGFAACALGFARRQTVTEHRLLEGARRWPAFLRSVLCFGAVYFAISYGLLMVLMPLYFYTPAGSELYADMDSLMLSGELTEEALAQLQQALAPIYAIWLPLLVAVMVLLRYFLLGLTHYRLLDEDRPGAIRAMLGSAKLLHRHRLELLKLDLSYWWYGLLSLLTGAILWLPEILTALKITLPLDSNVLYLLCYLVFIPAVAALYLTALPRRETAYALFYNRLLCQKRTDSSSANASSE